VPDERTCEDCANLIEAERNDLPGLDGPALHIAVGALYGGSACDHVDYGPEDEARAGFALWNHAIRQRDKARAEVAQLRAVIDKAYDVAQEMSHDDCQALVCVLEVIEPFAWTDGPKAR
jgi:hypothetical protein